MLYEKTQGFSKAVVRSLAAMDDGCGGIVMCNVHFINGADLQITKEDGRYTAKVVTANAVKVTSKTSKKFCKVWKINVGEDSYVVTIRSYD